MNIKISTYISKEFKDVGEKNFIIFTMLNKLVELNAREIAEELKDVSNYKLKTTDCYQTCFYLDERQKDVFKYITKALKIKKYKIINFLLAKWTKKI